jgi:hypothetical protein
MIAGLHFRAAYNVFVGNSAPEQAAERGSARDHVASPSASTSGVSRAGASSAGKGSFFAKIKNGMKSRDTDTGSKSNIQKAGIFIKDFLKRQTVDKFNHFSTEFANLVDEVVGKANDDISSEMKEVEKLEEKQKNAKAADKPAAKVAGTSETGAAETVAAAKEAKEQAAKTAQDAQAKAKDAVQMYEDAKQQMGKALSSQGGEDDTDINTARSTLGAVEEVMKQAQAAAQDAQAKAEEADRTYADAKKQAAASRPAEVMHDTIEPETHSDTADMLAAAKQAKTDAAAKASAAAQLYDEALAQATPAATQERGIHSTTTGPGGAGDVLADLKKEKELAAAKAKDADQFYDDVVAQADPGLRMEAGDKTDRIDSSKDKPAAELKSEETHHASAQFHIEGAGSFVATVNSMLASLNDLKLLPPLSEEQKKNMTPEGIQQADAKRREDNDMAMKMCLAYIFSQVEQMALERKKTDAAIQALFTQ